MTKNKHEDKEPKNKNEEKSSKNIEKEQKNKIKQLEEQLQEANETIEDLTNNFINAENMNKSLNISCVELKNDLERIKERNKNIVEEANENAIVNIVKDFLPILDNFDSALRVVENKEILHGFELIYNQTKTMLKNLGVEEIIAVGEEFNPEIHNAIMKEPSKQEGDSGKVATEYQKGYKFKDRIVRYSTVSVFE